VDLQVVLPAASVWVGLRPASLPVGLELPAPESGLEFSSLAFELQVGFVVLPPRRPKAAVPVFELPAPVL
jgi:hypothetical protein